jgi:hypothetical protein
MNLYLYIPPTSAHPTSCIKGLIVGNFIRFRNQNNDENFCQLIENFAKHLYERGHSLQSIRFHFLRAAKILDQKLLNIKPILQNPETQTTADDPITASIKNRPLYLHWQFHPNGLTKNTIRSIFNSTLQNNIPYNKRMTTGNSTQTDSQKIPSAPYSTAPFKTTSHITNE